MDIREAIDKVNEVLDYLNDVQVEHEAQEEGDDLPEALFDLDIYCDGGYCNLDDAVSTLESARDLLIELRRLNPRLVPDGYDSAGRLRV